MGEARRRRKRVTRPTMTHFTKWITVTIVVLSVIARVEQSQSDFTCEDEGFFPHPRDCKKYFWCLDSGPSALGLVAHQFTCPSGLVFNKGVDSCDYSRNVMCDQKQTKGGQARESASTAKSEANISTSTTAEPPSSRSTTTEDSQVDPRAIKRLVTLIKELGGVDELEKLFKLEESASAGAKTQESTTPTISRNLYEKVFSGSFVLGDEYRNRNGPQNKELQNKATTENINVGRKKEKTKYIEIKRKRPPETTDNDNAETKRMSDDARVVGEEKSPGLASTLKYSSLKRTRSRGTTSTTEMPPAPMPDQSLATSTISDTSTTATRRYVTISRSRSKPSSTETPSSSEKPSSSETPSSPETPSSSEAPSSTEKPSSTETPSSVSSQLEESDQATTISESRQNKQLSSTTELYSVEVGLTSRFRHPNGQESSTKRSPSATTHDSTDSRPTNGPNWRGSFPPSSTRAGSDLRRASSVEDEIVSRATARPNRRRKTSVPVTGQAHRQAVFETNYLSEKALTPTTASRTISEFSFDGRNATEKYSESRYGQLPGASTSIVYRRRPVVVASSEFPEGENALSTRPKLLSSLSAYSSYDRKELERERDQERENSDPLEPNGGKRRELAGESRYGDYEESIEDDDSSLEPIDIPVSGKVSIRPNGFIRCLDTGNFPHPFSCNKFISCAKMQTARSRQISGWEYTCPRGLSFDPIGGICNWSAGLGCNQ